MTDHLNTARARLEVGNWPSAQAHALIDIAESLRKLVDAQKPKTYTVGVGGGGGGGGAAGSSSVTVSVGGAVGGGASAAMAREVSSLADAGIWARMCRWIDRDGEEWRFASDAWRMRLKDGSWTASVVPDSRYGMYRRLA